VALVAFWLFTAVCLRIGCWFSLVETSFGRCALLALLSAIFLVLALGVLAGIGYIVVCRQLPLIVLAASAGVLVLLYIVGSVILTKRILLCKWRSVVTVGIMAAFVGDTLALGFMAVLFVTMPRIMATESLQEFITAILHSQ